MGNSCKLFYYLVRKSWYKTANSSENFLPINKLLSVLVLIVLKCIAEKINLKKFIK